MDFQAHRRTRPTWSGRCQGGMGCSGLVGPVSASAPQRAQTLLRFLPHSGDSGSWDMGELWSGHDPDRLTMENAGVCEPASALTRETGSPFRGGGGAKTKFEDEI